MAAQRGSTQEAQASDTRPPSLGPSAAPDCFSETLVAFRPEMSPTTQLPGVSQLDQDIRSLLQALPTRINIEAMILRLEETHRRDVQKVREDVTTETSLSILTNQVSALEQSQDAQRETTTALQLHLEKIEDRSRRKNLRLQGLPEAT